MLNLMPLDERYPIERSRLLDVFNFSQYTPDEMLLLDVYLSKINPADPGTKKVQFRKKEYETFLQKPEQQYRTFKKAALGLFSKFIDPEHLPEDIEFDPRHIWKELSFKKIGGEWVFTMECDEKAEPFFFNTQKYGFIRYLVGYTKNFTSKYSFLLYYYFKRKRQEEIKFGNPISPTVAELKRITGTASKKTYKEFKYFRRDVIDKAVEEICAFTDIDVSYEIIKTGRTVNRIHFTVTEKAIPPLLGEEPSKELTELFSEELEGMGRLPDPEEAAEPTAMTDINKTQPAPQSKRRGRPQKSPTSKATPTPPPEEPAQPVEPERAPTVYEMDLMAAIPAEVHRNELPRIDAILNIIRKYIPYPDILIYMQDGMSLADASSAASDDFNEKLLDIIHSFNTQEYNIRKDGIMHPNAHFSYYMVNLDGWLSKGRR